MTSQTRRLRTTLPLRSNLDRNRLCLTNSYRNGRSHVVPTEASTALLPVAVGRIDEWHVDIGKSRRENEMGEKGLTCSDGFDYEPIFGKEAQQCIFLTTDGFANK